MTKERINDFKKIVLPSISKFLFDVNYEGQGKCDAEEFAKDFNEILDLATKALEQEPKTGHWIIEGDCEGKTRTCVCDICGEKTGKYTWKNPNYCSNCGAKMFEPMAESEDKK